MRLEPGLVSTAAYTVGNEDTAIAVGSGDLPVLATPRLIAWAEERSVDAVGARLDQGATSVGTRIHLEHVRPTPVGETVTITARLAHVDGRLLQFEVIALNADDTVTAHGHVTRVVVDRQRFLSRATGH